MLMFAAATMMDRPNARDDNAEDASPDRREPWHRPCDRQAFLLGRLARPHLLAAGISGGLPLGVGARGSYPPRPLGSRIDDGGGGGNKGPAERWPPARAGQ